MLILNKTEVAKQVKEGVANRAQIKQLETNHSYREASKDGKYGFAKLIKNAGLTPDEAYRYIETMTVISTDPVGEFATWNVLQGTSKSINLGHEQYTYRQASEQTGGTVSMSGNTGITTDKVEYANKNAVIPIIDHGTRREFREFLTMSADGFDAWADDTREAQKVLFRTSNNYLWDGRADIKSKDGAVWLGLRGDPSLVQETTSVDMANNATTGKVIVAELGRLLDIMEIDNNCAGPKKLGISMTMHSYWTRTRYSDAEPSAGTIMDAVMKLGFEVIYRDPKLVGGKQLLLAEFGQDGLQAITGQAYSTYIAERVRHNDAHVAVNWMAQGYVAKQDFASKKTAMYVKSA
jgi:hypothetical protein